MKNCIETLAHGLYAIRCNWMWLLYFSPCVYIYHGGDVNDGISAILLMGCAIAILPCIFDIIRATNAWADQYFPMDDDKPEQEVDSAR